MKQCAAKSRSVRLSTDILNVAKAYASLNSCSVTKQVERWAKIGKIAEENPDLPYEFIAGALDGLAEIKRGEVSAFEFRFA